MPKIEKHHYLEDLTVGQKKEAQQLADTLDNKWALTGKNFKKLTGEHADKWELRGRDWLRVVFDRGTRNIICVFKKKWHDTTWMYM